MGLARDKKNHHFQRGYKVEQAEKEQGVMCLLRVLRSNQHGYCALFFIFLYFSSCLLPLAFVQC